MSSLVNQSRILVTNVVFRLSGTNRLYFVPRQPAEDGDPLLEVFKDPEPGPIHPDRLEETLTINQSIN